MDYRPMSTLKAGLTGLVAALALCGAAPAAAASFQLWNGSAWVNSGNFHFQGPIAFHYLGVQLPCDADFNVQVDNGSASVTAATFSGSNACAAVVAQGLPWPITPGLYTGPNPPFTGAPTLTGPLYSVAFSGIRVYLPPPMNVVCPSTTGSGTINGVLDSTGRLVFRSNVGPCTIQTRPGGALQASVTIRVI